MGMMTGREYIDSLRALKLEVYFSARGQIEQDQH